MFILREVIVFVSMLTCCLWFQCGNEPSLSKYLEIPLFGCFLLIGSSVTVTAFHHKINRVWGTFHLLSTILLGIGFVCLQVVEFRECYVDLVRTVYHAACFCTVGLHFSHVVIGLAFLVVLLVVGSAVFGEYYYTLFIWYWHFVDYIWVLVYSVVYLC